MFDKVKTCIPGAVGVVGSAVSFVAAVHYGNAVAAVAISSLKYAAPRVIAGSVAGGAVGLVVGGAGVWATYELEKYLIRRFGTGSPGPFSAT
jgi:hypothetical protein